MTAPHLPDMPELMTGLWQTLIELRRDIQEHVVVQKDLRRVLEDISRELEHLRAAASRQGAVEQLFRDLDERQRKVAESLALVTTVVDKAWRALEAVRGLEDTVVDGAPEPIDDGGASGR